MIIGFRHLCVGVSFALAACSNEPPAPLSLKADKISGIHPDIVAGDVELADKAALSSWIDETTALMTSPAFESNFKRASLTYPQVYVSKTQDIISSDLLLTRLKTEDPRLTALWWPKTYVVLTGERAKRLQNRGGFGFEAIRTASAGPIPDTETEPTTGQITLGRLHFARYVRGDTVEKSCAINTMAHEISHTLSDKADIFWMHILDSQRETTPPRRIFEASYFIGSVAQCTYLENIGRIAAPEFESCMLTFSDPSQSSRFRSRACDDFPDDKPISGAGHLNP